MPSLTRTPFHGESDWKSAVERATAGGGRAAEGRLVYVEDREDLRVEADSADGLQILHTRHRGLSARSALTVPTWVHVSDPSPEDAGELVRYALGETARLPPRRSSHDEALPALAVSAATDLVTRLEHAARRGSAKARVRVAWVGFVQDVLLSASGQAAMADRRTGARLRIEVRLAGSRTRSCAVEETVLAPDRPPSASALEELARGVMIRAERRLAASDPPRGPVTVVFAPGVGGVLIHELVGHALEADTAARGSWLAGREDRVAPETFVVVDDPRRGRAPWKIDDEGTPARPTPLVHEGRVRGLLLDRLTAARAGRPPTGHGRRASYRDPVRPRMGCTFLAAGSLTPGEVLESTTGIYVRRMESASTDPASGQATFLVTDADALQDGRRSRPLTPHLLCIDGAHGLTSLDRIGNDTEFDTCIGSCHRENQALSVSVGAPTFRLRVATVVG